MKKLLFYTATLIIAGCNSEVVDSSKAQTEQNRAQIQADSMAKEDLDKRQDAWFKNTPHIDGFGTVGTDKNLNYVYEANIINPKNRAKIIGLQFEVLPKNYRSSYENKIKISILPGKTKAVKFPVPTSSTAVSIKEVYYEGGSIERPEDSFPRI